MSQDEHREKRQNTAPGPLPACPNFGSGPCAKRPGYEVSTALRDAALGRSHRSALGKQKIGFAISETKRILQIPDDYLVGIVAGSDTGAMEMAMWNLLGPRHLDVFCWEAFGSGWAKDAEAQLPLKTEKGGQGLSVFEAEYGDLPDLSKADPAHDLIFTLNGTTSGVCIPNFDWISVDREGLSICDATSGIFAMPIEWSKVDVVTFSWQKVLGGEAGHGMLVLSPRAVQRLETYQPSWPIPKVFKLTANKKIDRALFVDSPINTLSLMCVEDYLDALRWVNSIGGLEQLMARCNANFQALEAFVSASSWLKFLATDKSFTSHTSVCLSVTDMTAEQIKAMLKLLETEGAAFDIGSYKDAPTGIRVWCGATVETKDIQALTVWLEWAHQSVLTRS